MGILTNVLNDPNRLALASQMLLGFGQSALQAGAPPPRGQASPGFLGGLGQAVSGGTSALQQAMLQQEMQKTRALQNQLMQQQIQANEQKASLGSILSSSISPERIDPGVAGPARGVETQRLERNQTPGGMLGSIATNIAGVAPEAAIGLIGQQAKMQAAAGTAKFKQVRDGGDFVTLDLSQPDPASKFRFKEVSRSPVREGAPVINVGGKGETEFQKTLGKQLGTQVADIIKRGDAAVGQEQTFRQLGDLIAGGVRSGTIQPAVTSLQALADDLGVDISGIAKRLGIDIGDVGSQQEFDRLTRQVVIEGFEKFKGNLNSKEVDLAIGAFANLGKSEEANIKAVASGLAGQQIARERAQDAALVETQQDARALQREILRGDVERFEELRAQFEQELIQRRSGGGTPGFRVLRVE